MPTTVWCPFPPREVTQMSEKPSRARLMFATGGLATLVGTALSLVPTDREAAFLSVLSGGALVLFAVPNGGARRLEPAKGKRIASVVFGVVAAGAVVVAVAASQPWLVVTAAGGVVSSTWLWMQARQQSMSS